MTEAWNSRLAASASEPVAIVGLSCRFPGASSPAEFWRLLEGGVDAVRPVPADRWNIDDYFDPTPGKPGKMSAREGGFIEQIDQFDAQFFGITPREASRMDPQQRLLLELSWEALEHAGLAPERLAGSDTGVFVGLTTTDYTYLQTHDLQSFNGHAGMGGGHCIATGRLSYFYDFHGPNIALDTACSSSLVAVHLACQSIRNRECSVALAGGVNVMAAPHCTVFLSEWGVLAPDGRCKTYSASANGFGRGEGCGFVVLKRLSDALADGDNILAVIRGTAINQDGRGTRLSAPNVNAQIAVVRKALADGGIDPQWISFVEAHGTGTSLGDPIEVEALTAAIGQPRTNGVRCALGSVKANVAHLEAAAGVAGLIKTVLALEHQAIPKQLHLNGLNPRIRLEGTPLYVPDQNVPWVITDNPRFAGVSSFGLSGTNSHVIVSDPPPRVEHLERAERSASEESTAHVLPISARSKEALRALAGQYCDLLRDSHQAGSLADICYSAAVRRSHHAHRLAVTGRTRDELAQRLAALSENDLPAPVHSGSPERLVFVFSGQGSQYPGMGRGLLAREPVFRDTLREIDELFTKLSGWSLLVELAKENTSRIGDTEVAQPAIFAIQMGLVALYKSWGIVPDVAIGHSAGEVAAACAAGVLSLADATRVVYHRSRLMQRAHGQGRMAAVGLSPAEAEQAIAPLAGRLSLASINGPSSVVISGEAEPLAKVLDQLSQRKVFSKDLGVQYAFHTRQMDPLLDELRATLADIRPQPARLQLLSTVTGDVVAGPAMTADYWARNVRQTVRFAPGIDRLLGDECRVFLEIGAQPVLGTPLVQCLRASGQEGTVLASLRQGQDERSCLMQSVGGLYVAGCEVDWERINPPGRFVALPTYPWQRKRYWLPSTPTFTSTLVPQHSAAAPANPAAPPASANGHGESDLDVISSFYDRVSSTTGSDRPVQHLTFAPFPEIVPGHSWLRTFYQLDDNPAFHALTVKAHQQMRQVLFRGIDLASIHGVLDFGCGYGTDLRTLAQEHPHLACDGYTLSPKQCELGNREAQAAGLADRVKLYCRDSASDEFPHHYDLAFGFEVAHYIEDKHMLFAHVERHLADGGFVVLADFIANTVSEIRHQQTNSFFSTVAQWCEVLAEHKLRVVECADVSQEMANFLHDPRAEENLALIVSRLGNEGEIRGHLASYDGLGKLFRKKLATYGLFTIQKDRFLSKAEIARINRDKLSSPTPYCEVVVRMGLAKVDDSTATKAASRTADYLYELCWEPAPLPDASATNGAAHAAGTWLILADEQGIGRAAAQELAKFGQTPILVQAGPQYQSHGSDRFAINPANPSEFRELLADALSRDLPACRGVLHLWGLDAKPPRRTTLYSLEADQVRGSGSLLHLVQALASVDWQLPPKIWIGTQGVHSSDSAKPAAVAQGALWGLGRSIAAEQPRFWGGLVDLDPTADKATAARWMVKELLGHQPEDQIAYRAAARHAARLRKLESATPAGRCAVSGEATYLITGGLGGLGLKVATWLVARGARHIALVQRSAVPPRNAWATVDPASPQFTQIAALRELESAGAQVHVFAADVAREEDVARLLADVRRTMPPLKGVMHTAGVLDDGILTQLDLPRLSRVLAAKLSGGWNLHHQTLSDDLDSFVLFSSAAGLLGSPGQGNYAAANAGLDTLAHFRRGEGLPALSIDWGPWSEVGMAAAQANRGQRVAQNGIASLSPAEGVEILERLLGQDRPQVAAIALDAAQLARSWPQAAKMPLLSELFGGGSPEQAPTNATPPIASQRSTTPTPPLKSAGGSIRQTLLAAATSERRKQLDDFLRREAARILQLPAADLDFRLPLIRMGIDSLMAVELRNVLELELAASVPLVSLLEGASLADLSSRLLADLGGSSADGSSRLSQALAQLENLSDEAVEAMLVEKQRLIGS